jgi:predicted site-specific integrase-resolvase
MLEVTENTFYTLQEINHGLGITIFTLRNWIKKGRLKAKKTGLRYFVQGKDLKDLLRTGTQERVKREK